MTRLLSILLLLPAIASAAGLGVYNPAQHAVNGFMPTQIPGCYLWVYAGSGGFTNGSSVDLVRDFGPNAMNMIALTGSRQPTVGSENGRPVWILDGVDDFLQATNFGSYSGKWTNGMSVWVVVKWSTKAWTGNFGTDLQAIVDNTHGDYASFVIQDRPDLTPTNTVVTFSRLPSAGATVNGALATNKLGNNALRVLGGYKTRTNESIVSNGSTFGSQTNTYITNAIQSRFSIGYWANGRYLGGRVGECVVVADEMSDHNRMQLQRYLGTKYGIVVQ